MFLARPARLRRVTGLALAGATLAFALALSVAPARACDAAEMRGLIGRGFTDAEIDRHCAATDAATAAPSPDAPASDLAENQPACPPNSLIGDWTAETLPETAGAARLAARDARALWRVGRAGAGATLSIGPRRWPIQPAPDPAPLIQSRCEAGVLTLVWDETTETGADRMVVRLVAPEPGGLGGALSDRRGEAPAPGQADLAWGEYLRERRAGLSTAATREFGRMRLERTAPLPAPEASPPDTEARPGIARLPVIAPPSAQGGLAGLPGFDEAEASSPAAARERLIQLRAARDMCKASFFKAVGVGGRDMCGAFDATIAELERISGL